MGSSVVEQPIAPPGIHLLWAARDSDESLWLFPVKPTRQGEPGDFEWQMPCLTHRSCFRLPDETLRAIAPGHIARVAISIIHLEPVT